MHSSVEYNGLADGPVTLIYSPSGKWAVAGLDGHSILLIPQYSLQNPLYKLHSVQSGDGTCTLLLSPFQWQEVES